MEKEKLNGKKGKKMKKNNRKQNEKQR